MDLYYFILNIVSFNLVTCCLEKCYVFHDNFIFIPSINKLLQINNIKKVKEHLKVFNCC